MRTRTITTFHNPRESWAIHYNMRTGFYMLQRAYSDGHGGHRFDPSLPDHREFKTRTAAELFKKALIKSERKP